jgi:hypothetical protein
LVTSRATAEFVGVGVSESVSVFEFVFEGEE